MYSTVKKISIFSIILAVINALATVLFFLYFFKSDLGFAMIFTCSVYLITATVGFLLISIALNSLYKDLNLEAEAKAAQANQLSKRIKELESKVNY